MKPLHPPHLLHLLHLLHWGDRGRSSRGLTGPWARRLAVAATGCVVVAAGVSLGACFESGPLGARPAGGDALGDTALPVADVPAPRDHGGQPPADGGAGADAAPRDGDGDGDGGAGPDAATDGGGGPACLTDEECAQPPGGDLCAGAVRCLDYECQVDPATVVSCPPTGDPCHVASCDPATGACVVETVCTCEPMGTLGCLMPASFSVFDPGATSVMDGYACGPPGGDGPEHTWRFSVPETQQVRITASGAGEGLWVVGFDGQACHAGSCVAGGAEAVAFQAVGGYQYAIVVEHGAAAAGVVELQAKCGVTIETECGDGLDDDGNGATDCDDPACAGKGTCPQAWETVCDDGLDEDANGATDCEDEACALAPVCLQTCEPGVAVYCGFHQYSIPTGGGKANATDYACGGVTAPGKEIVYTYTAQTTDVVQVTLATSQPGVALYLLREEGHGCTPKACIDHDYQKVFIAPAAVGETYYLVVDAPEGVTANVDLLVDCLP